MSSTVRGIGFFAAFVLAPATAIACTSFGADHAAVERVQSSWAPAEHLMAQHRYTAALAMLSDTEKFLPRIHDAFVRGCVGEGAGVRIASAKAGNAYLSSHPRDVAGAQLAARRAWTSYPMGHNCP